MRKAGWQRMTIGDVCDVVNGGTPKTGVSAYWDGPHQWSRKKKEAMMRGDWAEISRLAKSARPEPVEGRESSVHPSTSSGRTEKALL